MKHALFLAIAFLVCTAGSAFSQDTLKPLRAGIIGLDTSHVPAFTKLFNNPKADGDLAGIKVVAGYPGGTDMPASKDRVAKFTEQVRGMGVEIVDSIPKLLEKVDVVLIESVDGRIHLKEAREVFKSGKLVYIDKPLAGALPESIALFELAKKHHVKTWSSSSSRFGADLLALKGNEEIGDILGVTTWGPCSYQSGTPDLFFYAIHGIESLFTLMGTGCETVSRSKGPVTDQVTGTWKDGRIGTYRGIVRGKSEFGAIVYGSKGVRQGAKTISYEALCRQIGKFFRTGEPPVSEAETIEIFTFMEAADESLRQGGKPVALAEVLAKAKEEAAKLVP
ncbi:Gfo/Idh/MocA family protein [Prosthecobacter vanneervenii]|uniref:Putative dehydrogenase n=1 Tax=Prosthecobacter vanneervenii TaxID=48466 RepID=A0A7W8DMF9_9BACT|nr:Gfo/Idh/MocA family oxidoreductase [Prosthecobacter vanneervenii]MBB5035268.1 putative dehydrogenase [Prosthecobacter vanneervenii]